MYCKKEEEKRNGCFISPNTRESKAGRPMQRHVRLPQCMARGSQQERGGGRRRKKRKEEREKRGARKNRGRSIFKATAIFDSYKLGRGFGATCFPRAHPHMSLFSLSLSLSLARVARQSSAAHAGPRVKMRKQNRATRVSTHAPLCPSLAFICNEKRTCGYRGHSRAWRFPLSFRICERQRGKERTPYRQTRRQ